MVGLISGGFCMGSGWLRWGVVLGMSVAASALPVHLRTEQRVNPMGVDAAKPSFSWQSDAQTQDWMQTAREVMVASSAAKLAAGKADVWDSGKVASSESASVAYDGPQLESKKKYWWAVKVWDNKGGATTSQPAWFEMGMLHPEDWKAQWIRRSEPAADREFADVKWMWLAGEDAFHSAPGRPAEFRYTLHLDTLPTTATLHVAAVGTYVAKVNGVVTGEHSMWGSFDWEEIRHALKVGDNEIVLSVKAPAGPAASKVPAAIAASLRISDPKSGEQRLVSGTGWMSRAEGGEWKPANVIGGMATSFEVGKNERKFQPPTRISSDVALLRKTFELGKAVKSARLRMTAMGAYRAYINGEPVSKATLLDPGFTDFNKRVLYQTYDVTALLRRGNNAVGVMLAPGWHGSPLLWSGIRFFRGPDMLLGQLDVTFADGSTATVGTDGSWQADAAPVKSSEIYGGESYDARSLHGNWTTVQASGGNWTPAQVSTEAVKAALTAQPDLSVHQTEVVKPAKLDPANSAHPAVFDMGQNMVGNVVLHVHGKPGETIKLRYAERLNPDGSIYTENLRNATVTDYYTLRGGAEETYEPMFTFHGFRYVEVSGGSAPVTMATVEGHVYNSLPETPSIRFTSSSELLNAMGKLGFWGQRGNFVSIPTDCPQRDERMGWMGDAGVFWRTGTYNFDIASFTHKFMMDIDDAQEMNGAFTDISPNLLTREEGAPGWADAGVLVPYAAWLQYGDTALLERSWPQMNRFMDFIHETNPDWLRKKKLGANYADWLAPDQHTPKDLIATAYWAIIARDMQEMATALGKPEDAAKYKAVYEHVADAYRKAYVHADGTVQGNTQTGYVVTLYAGIAPEAMRTKMTGLLVKDIEAHQNHLTTGFLGTPFLMFVLDENGRSDVAYKLLLQDTYPSWGYMVRKGATTWWERWNGDTGDPSMNSYNHYAFGSVMAWVFRRVAGIDTDAAGAGYHHLTIRPQWDASLPKMHTEYDSAYGTVMTDYDRATGAFQVKLPANARATVVMPGGKTEEIGSGIHRFTAK